MNRSPFTSRPCPKTTRRILSTGAAGLLSALAAMPVARSQIALTGATTYTQNFDAIGIATIPWVDNSTLPGWYAGINANATPDGNLTISDGTTAALTGLLNLGTASAVDRALGSKATGTGNFANIAFGVLFQNTSAQTLNISNIGYTGELWRTNTTAGGVAEQWVTFTKISATTFNDVEPGASAATANTGTFTAAPLFNWASPTNTPVDTALDGNLAANRTVIGANPNLLLSPGQFFMFRWVDTNLAGTDGHQGIDDFSITFTAIPNLVYNLSHAVGGAPAGNLEVSANQYWLDAGAGAGFANNSQIAFSQDGTATVGVPANVTPLSTTVSAASGTYTIGGAGRIAGPLTKSGAGTLVLTSANSFTSTTIGGGVVELQNAGALGTGAVTLNGTGGTLRIRDNGAGNNGTITYGNNLTITSASTVDLDRATGGASVGNTVAFGTLSVGAQTLTVTGTNGYKARFNGSVTLTANATIDTNTEVVLAGAISGSFGLTKTGAGLLTMNGTNTYFGSTNVSGGTLGGVGRTGGALNVNTGGTLAPGSGVGIFTTTTNITLGVGSTLSIDIAHTSVTPVAGTDYDQLKVGTGAGATSTGTVTLGGGNLALSIGTGIVNNDIFFVILNDGTDLITGTFNGLAQGATLPNGLFRISYTADSVGGTETGGNDVALIAVPEPGTALLAFLGAATLLRRRR